MSNTETIKHAAIRTQDEWIFIGKCHADCFSKAMFVGKNLYLSSKAKDQGFVTSSGRYVERDEAAKIVVSSGQIERVTGGVLCSEDLWSEEHGGEFNYDEIKGYYK